MHTVLRFACPAADLNPSKDFAFQMLRKMSTEPSCAHLLQGTIPAGGFEEGLPGWQVQGDGEKARI